MDNTQIETVLQNIGNLLLKVSVATADFLEMNVLNLLSVSEQRQSANTIRKSAENLRLMLGSLGPNRQAE